MKKFSARPKRLQPKSQDRPELCAPVELEAHLLAFGSTIGTYLLPKDEGKRPTDIREQSLSFFRWISLDFPSIPLPDLQ